MKNIKQIKDSAKNSFIPYIDNSVYEEIVSMYIFETNQNDIVQIFEIYDDLEEKLTKLNNMEMIDNLERIFSFSKYRENDIFGVWNILESNFFKKFLALILKFEVSALIRIQDIPEYKFMENYHPYTKFTFISDKIKFSMDKDSNELDIDFFINDKIFNKNINMIDLLFDCGKHMKIYDKMILESI
ncbi:hypothetical protein FPHOBKDP_00047 [Listeria phage LPJP1]|nr:hypothetical protein FPHOBKDP_00047 [Listeria phage LPJP1]